MRAGGPRRGGVGGAKWSSRKNTVLVIIVIALIGMLLQNAIPSYWGAMVGRMVNAVSMGLEANNIPLFMSELSSTAIRGSLIKYVLARVPRFSQSFSPNSPSSFYQWWQIVGIIIAHAIVLRTNIVFPDSQWCYRIVMVVQIAIPLMLLGVYWILPESPRWLLSKCRRDDAKKALIYIRDGAAADDEVEEELRLTEESIAEQREFHHASSYVDCFKSSNLRRTIISGGIQVLQQLSGNAFMSSYAVIFLKQAGITNVFTVSLARVCMALAGATMGFYLPDRIGRRPLLIGAAFVMWAGLWLTSGIATWWPGSINGGATSQGLLFLILIWSMMSTASWGSCVWIVTVETPTAQLREKTVRIATTVSFICVILVSYINPFVQEEPGNLGSRIGFVYGSFSFLAMFFVYFVVPELKSRSLEELDELFQAGIPAWKFRRYQAHGIGARITEIQNINASPHMHITKAMEAHNEEVAPEAEVVKSELV